MEGEGSVILPPCKAPGGFYAFAEHARDMTDDWVAKKAREMISAGSSVWAYCPACRDLTQFNGDACKKCGKVKK